MDKCVYFTDKFFSSGKTDIFDESQEKVGTLNLQSTFSSRMSVENEMGECLVEGSFPFLSNKWVIKGLNGVELGKVSATFSFFSKRYRYTTDHNTYEIESPAFSNEYSLLNENNDIVATFKKVNGIFQAPAYQLNNESDFLHTEELIAVVMGVNEIEKRRRSSVTTVQ